MKKIDTHRLGVDQGDVVVFSDFNDGGEMWTGQGARERRRAVAFSGPFRAVPAVHLSISLWDADTGPMMRAELVAENVTTEGFDVVFRTWMDSRFARLRVAWMAIGDLSHEDDWEIG